MVVPGYGKYAQLDWCLQIGRGQELSAAIVGINVDYSLTIH